MKQKQQQQNTERNTTQSFFFLEFVQWIHKIDFGLRSTSSEPEKHPNSAGL